MYHNPDACTACPVRASCTPSKRGRQIYRWEHQEIIDTMQERMKAHPEIYARRKGLIEHVFGVFKGPWQYTSLLMRGVLGAATEGALMSLAFLIRRAINIAGVPKLLVAIASG